MTEVITADCEPPIALRRPNVPLSLSQLLKIDYPSFDVSVIRQVHTQRTLELRSIIRVIFTRNKFMSEVRLGQKFQKICHVGREIGCYGYDLDILKATHFRSTNYKQAPPHYRVPHVHF